MTTRTTAEDERNDRVLISILTAGMLIFLVSEVVNYIKSKRSLRNTVESCRVPPGQENGNGSGRAIESTKED